MPPRRRVRSLIPPATRTRRAVRMPRLAPLLAALALAAPARSQAPDFDRAVAPILANRCLPCHSGSTTRGGLDLSRLAGARAGGDSGKVLVPGKPDDSPLWQRVHAGEMPPKKPLPAAEKAILRAWLAAGAR